MKVDILFCTKNRVEYAEEAFRQLVRNTNWGMVNSLMIHFDGSSIGEFDPFKFRTTTYNEAGNTGIWPQSVRWTGVLRQNVNAIGSPVGVMDYYLKDTKDTGSPWFAKIDNDTIVPPGWLDACVAIADWSSHELMKVTGNVDLIGIEARYCENPPMQPVTSRPGPFTPYPVVKYRQTDHIGGIGLFRRAVFEKYPLALLTEQEKEWYRSRGQDPRYYGFTEWQWSHPDVRKVWIDPPLPVFLLDHLPMEPWMSLGKQYVLNGWQRATWGYYDPEKDRGLWEWWLRQQHPASTDTV